MFIEILEFLVERGAFGDRSLSARWRKRRRAVRRIFNATAKGNILLGNSSNGFATIYTGDLGRAVGAVYDGISLRGSNRRQVALPFIARVLKVEGDRLFIDSGAEIGTSAGDTMILHQWREPPIRQRDQNITQT